MKESSEANGNGLHSSSGTSWTVPPSEPKFSKQGESARDGEDRKEYRAVETIITPSQTHGTL